jgi:hypothetical protein
MPLVLFDRAGLAGGVTPRLGSACNRAHVNFQQHSIWLWQNRMQYYTLEEKHAGTTYPCMQGCAYMQGRTCAQGWQELPTDTVSLHVFLLECCYLIYMRPRLAATYTTPAEPRVSH